MAIFEDQDMTVAVFEELESEVRGYCRTWPVVFDRARGSYLYDEHGRPYLDFFCGAGALSYGHNNALLKEALLDYLLSDRVVHGLDMFTAAKREFLACFEQLILRPRGLEYRVQFPGPAGTTAVEAALKLARKVTGRRDVVCFTNAFHGTSLGALAMTASPLHRGAAGVALEHAPRLPFGQDPGGSDAGLELLGELLGRAGETRPAAVILETVQGEGGVNVAPVRWLAGVAELCRRHGVLLIVDDVQMGCGRTGPFFSFEAAGIEPDLVCLSKAISGYGLPLALTLLRPDLDVWEPGEHNGTFRGYNPAFVTGAAALRAYWSDERLQSRTLRNGRWLEGALDELARSLAGVRRRGRGMVQGLAFERPEQAAAVAAEAFRRGLLVERAGPQDEVVKLLPPLTASDEELQRGIGLLGEALRASA